MRVTATVLESAYVKNRTQKQHPSREVKWGGDSSRAKRKLYSKLRRASEEGCLGNGPQSALTAATAPSAPLSNKAPSLGHRQPCTMTGSYK